MFISKEVWVVIFHDARDFTTNCGEFESEEEAVRRAHEVVRQKTFLAGFLYGWCTIEHRVMRYRENETDY